MCILVYVLGLTGAGFGLYCVVCIYPKYWKCQGIHWLMVSGVVYYIGVCGGVYYY